MAVQSGAGPMALPPHFENLPGGVQPRRIRGKRMETLSELVDATLARYGVSCGAGTLVREVAIPIAIVQEPLMAQCPEPLPSGF
jgi:hypothetical protein